MPLKALPAVSATAPPADPAKLERLMSVTRGRAIVVAASTHPGEEEILIEAHKSLAKFFPGLLTVIVPRHAHRGEAVAQLVTAAGLRPSLRSHEDLPVATTDIYVADTMGELGLFYRLSDIVFMGGSLIHHGGQNPIEAIKLGAAIVHGPHVFNFTDVYDALDRGGGARLADDRDALVKQLGQFLADLAIDRLRLAEEIGDAGVLLVWRPVHAAFDGHLDVGTDRLEAVEPVRHLLGELLTRHAQVDLGLALGRHDVYAAAAAHQPDIAGNAAGIVGLAFDAHDLLRAVHRVYDRGFLSRQSLRAPETVRGRRSVARLPATGFFPTP